MKKINLAIFCSNLFLMLFCGLNLLAQQPPKTFIYRQIDADTLKAYVFQPTTPGENHPAILLFHGGGFKFGDASWCFDRAKEFAEKGIVSICIDYRLANNGLTPIDGIEDACAAFTWTRIHAKELRIDTKRVAGYGISAGGLLVACAAELQSLRGNEIPGKSRPNVMLLYSPALNVVNEKPFDALMQGKGNSADYSPSEFVSSKLPPTLIIQGEQDSITLARYARTYRDAAMKVGARCILVVYPRVGHLLTRNVMHQENDFDPDPTDVADAYKREDDFLQSLGYIAK
ncbi:MAG: alpha/beta hydrolase [Chitinophagaceae bacterium]|jgi:acetyl esterase/lipase|nr:MAG: alpha/beta hydrolase [Chitinophagaceae bacterium]